MCTAPNGRTDWAKHFGRIGESAWRNSPVVILKVQLK